MKKLSLSKKGWHCRQFCVAAPFIIRTVRVIAYKFVSVCLKTGSCVAAPLMGLLIFIRQGCQKTEKFYQKENK